MIKKMLVMIDQGPMTLSEMAEQTDLTEADLKNRLEMMVRMGHLEALHLDADAQEPEAACPGCVMAAKCQAEECSDGPPVVGYRLTDKGRRLARGIGPDGG